MGYLADFLSFLKNVRQPNGRINVEGTDNLAVSVSPSSPEFYENIEDGIKPVVEAFVSKGYFPISSCQGHFDSDEDWDNREISLAFPVETGDQWEKVNRFDALFLPLTRANLIYITNVGTLHFRPSLQVETLSRFLNVKGLEESYDMERQVEVDFCSKLFGVKANNWTFRRIWLYGYGGKEYREAVEHNTQSLLTFIRSGAFPSYASL
jgi:hypothetical protein